jgi:hypothetical protein
MRWLSARHPPHNLHEPPASGLFAQAKVSTLIRAKVDPSAVSDDEAGHRPSHERVVL